MCWQDVKIHRATAGRELRVTTDTNIFPILGPNPRRTAIVFMNVSAGTCQVSSHANMAAGTGITISTTSPPHRILLSEYGGVVKDAWYGLASAAGNVLSLVETDLPLREGEIDD